MDATAVTRTGPIRATATPASVSRRPAGERSRSSGSEAVPAPAGGVNGILTLRHPILTRPLRGPIDARVDGSDADPRSHRVQRLGGGAGPGPHRPGDLRVADQ